MGEAERIKTSAQGRVISIRKLVDGDKLNKLNKGYRSRSNGVGIGVARIHKFQDIHISILNAHTIIGHAKSTEGHKYVARSS